MKMKMQMKIEKRILIKLVAERYEQSIMHLSNGFSNVNNYLYYIYEYLYCFVF